MTQDIRIMFPADQYPELTDDLLTKILSAVGEATVSISGGFVHLEFAREEFCEAEDFRVICKALEEAGIEGPFWCGI